MVQHINGFRLDWILWAYLFHNICWRKVRAATDPPFRQIPTCQPLLARVILRADRRLVRCEPQNTVAMRPTESASPWAMWIPDPEFPGSSSSLFMTVNWWGIRGWDGGVLLKLAMDGSHIDPHSPFSGDQLTVQTKIKRRSPKVCVRLHADRARSSMRMIREVPPCSKQTSKPHKLRWFFWQICEPLQVWWTHHRPHPVLEMQKLPTRNSAGVGCASTWPGSTRDYAVRDPSRAKIAISRHSASWSDYVPF